MVKEGFEALQVHHLKILYFPSDTHNRLQWDTSLIVQGDTYTAPKATGKGASKA